MPRGGPRQLPPGKTSANRTDMNRAPRAQPAVAATGLNYGQHADLVRTQQAMPTPDNQATDAASIMEAAKNFDLSAAAAPPLHRPTERPHEPITAGAATGPGPGPEALGAPPIAPASLTDLFRSLAAADPSGDLAALASQAMALGQ